MSLILIVVVVIVVVSINCLLIILSSLNLTSVTFLSKRKIEIVAFDAYPILRIIIILLLERITLLGMGHFSTQ